MILKGLTIILVMFFCIISKAEQTNAINNQISELIQSNTYYTNTSIYPINTDTSQFQIKKWELILTNIFFGIFGMHRVYLGCKPYIPILYTATIGGAGVVVLIDLFILIFKQDYSDISQNRFIFWKK